MALTPLRWLGAAILLAGVATLMLLRDAGPQRGNEDESDYGLRERRAAVHLSTVAERLLLARIIDSVRRGNAHGATSQSRVLYGADLPPVLRRVAQRLADQVSVRRPASARVPVDLVFVLDTVSQIRGPINRVSRGSYYGLLRADYVLPGSGTAERCVAIVRMKLLSNPRWYGEVLRGPARGKLLGPCAFYETFGHPGPRIDSWLRGRAWSYGLASDWAAVLPPWKPRWWASWSRIETFYADWETRTAMTSRGYACATGATPSCDSALFDASTPTALRTSQLSSANVVSPRVAVDRDTDRNYRWSKNAEELGPREWSLLAEMVHDVGTERFSRFWQSSDDPRAAFRTATGRDIGDWARDWAQRAYGVQHRGPGVALAGAGYGVGVIGLALAFVVLTARRRYVA